MSNKSNAESNENQKLFCPHTIQYYETVENY